MMKEQRKLTQNGAQNLRVNKKQKQRNWLIFVGLLSSLAIIFGFIAYNYSQTYKNARNDIIELSKNSSKHNAERIDMFFTRHEDVLLVTAENIEYILSKDTSSEEKYNDVQMFLHNMSEAYSKDIYKPTTGKDFTGIYISLDGKMIHGFKKPEDLPAGYNPTERQWYLEAISGEGKVVFGEPYNDIYDPSVRVMTATKLLKDGSTVIGMDITMDDLQNAGSNMEVSVTMNGEQKKYGRGMILTGQGIVMSHWDKGEQGKDYSDSNNSKNDVFQKMQQCVENNDDYLQMKHNGIKLGIFPYQLRNGWYVVTLTDFDDIRTTISDFSKLTLIGTIVVASLALAYCVLISRAYTKSESLSENLREALDLATVDTLTGLCNRTAYDIKVRKIEENFNSLNDKPFVLIMMDLNDLKYVNDHFGHSEGDKYILNCCSLVKSIFNCDIYRIGGDEFAMFLTDELYDNWEELFDLLKQSVAQANINLTPSVDCPSISIGQAIHTIDDNSSLETILRKADAEMYTNKVAIKQSRLEHSEKGYTQDIKLKLIDKQMLASEMKKGLEEEQFEVWFQPQVNHANNGALIGAEALVRWKHPTKGMISPGVFIPLFEYNGLIYELDKYVWKHACTCLRKWIDDGMTPLPISINVSRLDIIQPDFMETIISIVEKENIPYDLIHLEVTESAFSDDTGKVAQIVKDLINRGFIIAIDDFGSGYSSLSLLRSIPAHIVKLDMRFFADGEDKSRNECIIESIIRMVKMLGMAVLAEGVEDVKQADLLRALGCAYIQGYLYSKPLPYDDYVKYTQNVISERVNRLQVQSAKELDVEVAQSQKLFHNIIAGTNDVIIVFDNITHQLLYANRSAETFFGKRFDPLHPTTCMEYCEKGKMCENCPAKDMKAGEKRETVSSVNGVHMKCLYTQMDWNGHDAVVFYQTDISAEMREMEFANTLMNNLGVGIVIFRGETPNELKPIFCNNEYLALSGLTKENFKEVLSKQALYGIYPDDIGEARAKFIEAYRNGHIMQHRFRVKKPNNCYEWVSLHASIRHLDDGAFEVYMIFADAEKQMRNMSIEIERYQNHIGRAKQTASKSLSVNHFNLTKNTCRCVHRSISVFNEPVFTQGVDAFLESVKNNLVDEKAQREFMTRFNSTTLKNNYEIGIFSDTIQIPIRLSEDRTIWCRQTVNVSKNPLSGDIEAVMSLIEADKDIRLNEYYYRIVKTDYDLIGIINTNTGFVNILSDNKNFGQKKISASAVSYMTSLVERMSAIVDDEYVDSCVNAMSLDTIVEKLKTADDYNCKFPAKQSMFDSKISFQWHFGYINEEKTEILFTRREL